MTGVSEQQGGRDGGEVLPLGDQETVLTLCSEGSRNPCVETCLPLTTML
jgi:hypothetical protein